jgi:hypothetical protein
MGPPFAVRDHYCHQYLWILALLTLVIPLRLAMNRALIETLIWYYDHPSIGK